MKKRKTNITHEVKKILHKNLAVKQPLTSSISFEIFIIIDQKVKVAARSNVVCFCEIKNIVSDKVLPTVAPAAMHGLK